MLCCRSIFSFLFIGYERSHKVYSSMDWHLSIFGQRGRYLLPEYHGFANTFLGKISSKICLTDSCIQYISPYIVDLTLDPNPSLQYTMSYLLPEKLFKIQISSQLCYTVEEDIRKQEFKSLSFSILYFFTFYDLDFIVKLLNKISKSKERGICNGVNFLKMFPYPFLTTLT